MNGRPPQSAAGHAATPAAGLRIALLTHSVNPRGGVMHTLALGDALQAAGHAVTVFAPAAPGQRLFRETACRFEPVPVAGTPRPLAALVASRIDAFCGHLAGRTGDFDVFHAQDGMGANALADLQDAGALPGGYLLTVHHLDAFDDPRVAAWQRRAIRRARRCLCVSRLWRERLASDHGIAALQVNNGVDLRRYTPAPGADDAQVVRRLGLAPGGPLVLAVGGVEARKNTRALLDAFALLRATRPRAQLVIAGGASLLDHDAYARGFHAALAAHGLAEAVRLTGPLPEAEMPALFRLADVLAMPSLDEGFGLVVLEALASGTPVAVSAVPPFTEHLLDAPAQAVHWCDPQAPASIAAAIDAALAAPAFAAPPRLCRRFTWARSARRHAAIYRGAAGEALAGGDDVGAAAGGDDVADAAGADADAEDGADAGQAGAAAGRVAAASRDRASDVAADAGAGRARAAA